MMSPSRDYLLQSLSEKLIHLIKNIHSRQECDFGQWKLSRPQVMSLFFIGKKKEGVSAKELKDFLNVTSGAITQLVDVLVKKKLVCRKEDKDDRRVSRLMLTETTKRKISTFKKKYHRSMHPFFSELNEKELESFVKLMEKIKTN